jgi:hypothetical protein
VDELDATLRQANEEQRALEALLEAWKVYAAKEGIDLPWPSK